MIFGFRDAESERNDYATSKQADTEVIEIPCFAYKEIITQTELKLATDKIDFLLRFGPAFR